MTLGRVDYVLFGDDTHTKIKALQRNFQVIEIETANIYHVLHKKHAALIPRLILVIKRGQKGNNYYFKMPYTFTFRVTDALIFSVLVL